MGTETRVMNVGILGCSAFALRAMGPAILECPGLCLKAIASRTVDKAEAAAEKLGCEAVEGYGKFLEDPGIDVIYMPLPTGLHLEWGLRALEAGKHLLVEKSIAGDVVDAGKLVAEARRRKLALLENFLFLRHTQIEWVRGQLAAETIGRLRMLRAAFTIPPLEDGNFRYSRALGGGALLDTGAYMVKTVSEFLGEPAEILGATMVESLRHGVDIGGSAMFLGKNGVAAQVAWGFDCHYQCSWDFVGETGRILCTRALTPPPNFQPPVVLEKNGCIENLELPAANHYVNQWAYFSTLIHNEIAREEEYRKTMRQGETLSTIQSVALKAILP